MSQTVETATLGGGCFWCLEAVYLRVDGVEAVESGYAGGQVDNPSYEQVCDGDTGHAEVVKVEFDPAKISYREILDIFFAIHDPTQLNRQGPDVGTQYRSAIFFNSPEQQRIAQAYIDQLNKAKVFRASIVTEVKPLDVFYPAEPYHQNYFARHPNDLYIVINDAPKVEHLRDQFSQLYR